MEKPFSISRPVLELTLFSCQKILRKSLSLNRMQNFWKWCGTIGKYWENRPLLFQKTHWIFYRKIRKYMMWFIWIPPAEMHREIKFFFWKICRQISWKFRIFFEKQLGKSSSNYRR